MEGGLGIMSTRMFMYIANHMVREFPGVDEMFSRRYGKYDLVAIRYEMS